VTRILSTVKGMVVPSRLTPLKIRSGLLQGLSLNVDLTSQTQLYLGLYEREIQRWIHKLSVGIHTAIDIGSEHGQYTLFFMTKTRAQRIFTFEPIAEKRAELHQNLKLNGLANSPRLEIIPKWVNSYQAQNEVALDSLLPQIRTPVLVKVDADTLEAMVLKGATELLKLPDVRWVIETHSKELEKACLSLLGEAGYRTKTVASAWWRLFVPELRSEEPNRWIIAEKL
jgi:hypothetical protein